MLRTVWFVSWYMCTWFTWILKRHAYILKRCTPHTDYKLVGQFRASTEPIWIQHSPEASRSQTNIAWRYTEDNIWSFFFFEKIYKDITSEADSCSKELVDRLAARGKEIMEAIGVSERNSTIHQRKMLLICFCYLYIIFHAITFYLQWDISLRHLTELRWLSLNCAPDSEFGCVCTTNESCTGALACSLKY